jgi:RNA polymerase sigma factor (sigma-70 family)
MSNVTKIMITVETIPNLQLLLEGCRQGNRRSQEMLYKQYYGYAMAVCRRYAPNRDEALEILNDGFMKVFNHIADIQPTTSFKNWLRRVMINTALDYYRQNKKYQQNQDIETAYELGDDEFVTSQLNYEALMGLVQNLTPMYRAVFNLYAIDGYTHEEIAEQLGISIGTSKSNLARARINLREMLSKIDL